MLEPALSQKEQGAGESSCLRRFASEALVLRVTFEPIGPLRVEEAAQWTLAHQGGNFNATTAPPLRRVLFLRGGRQWKNVLNFNLGGITASEVQLSFRDNAASSGNFTGSASGSIPVIKWTGPAAVTLLFEQVARLPSILLFHRVDPFFNPAASVVRPLSDAYLLDHPFHIPPKLPRAHSHTSPRACALLCALSNYCSSCIDALFSTPLFASHNSH